MARSSVLVLLLIAFAGLWTPARAADGPDAPDVAGVYVCDGVNAEGHAYRGIVEIVKSEGTFELKWTFPRSAESAMGIGIISNGVLAVSYYGGATAGVVVYKIEEGKKMVGEWTVVGAGGGVYQETLTKLPMHGQTPSMPNDKNHDPARPHRAPVQGDDSKLIDG